MHEPIDLFEILYFKIAHQIDVLPVNLESTILKFNKEVAHVSIVMNEELENNEEA